MLIYYENIFMVIRPENHLLHRYTSFFCYYKVALTAPFSGLLKLCYLSFFLTGGYLIFNSFISTHNITYATMLINL